MWTIRPQAPSDQRGRAERSLSAWLERKAGLVFLLPAVGVMLGFAIFPLLGSLYTSLIRLRFSGGQTELGFVGLANYRRLLVGSEQAHLLGRGGDASWMWAVLLFLALLLAWGLVRRYRRGQATGWSMAGGVLALTLAWLVLSRLVPGSLLGTLQTTLFYVFVGTALQYVLGLWLALLCAERLPGTRFFRVVFMLPLAITPVGIAYMFRMLTDTSKGPLQPIWAGLGLQGFSWVNDPWGARFAVLIGDTWQWTPFAFIVLLAALQSIPQEQVEAAAVDGATRWQTFRYVIFPYLLPASATLVLIRMIEGFKIVDLPNILTNGGPGTATESITLHAYFAWRTLDIGTAAALGFILLILVSLFSTVYARALLPRARGEA
ncbi:MAG: sugar ABC transporter permease [Meiothermus sp.]